MRLETTTMPPIDAGACRGKHRGNLGRVVTVVVDDHHAVFFAEPLESPFGTLELGERRRDRFERDADFEPTATAASALSRLWRPGTCSRSSPSSTSVVAARTFRSPVAHDRARPERLERHPVRRHARRRLAIGRRETVGDEDDA